MSTANSSVPNTFREADESEDCLLAGIYYNAFLPLWNHNYFQGLYEALPPIDPYASQSTLTPPQHRRHGFYLGLIRMTRLCKGSVYVLSDERTNDIHAILLWYPPHVRATLTPLGFARSVMSGFARTVIYDYGPGGFYRVMLAFEGAIDSMFAAAGIEPLECGFIQMLAANQAFRGNGSAKRLLEWQIERHRKDFPGAAVVLDTTTPGPVELYKVMGFEVVGERRLRTGTDKDGFWVRKGSVLSQEEKKEVEKTCLQTVMILRS